MLENINFTIAIAIVLIIILVSVFVYTRYNKKEPKTLTEHLDDLYNSDITKSEADSILNKTLEIEDKTPNDYFRIANIYRHFFNNDEKTHQYYGQTIKSILNENKHEDQIPINKSQNYKFFLDHIEEYYSTKENMTNKWETELSHNPNKTVQGNGLFGMDVPGIEKEIPDELAAINKVRKKLSTNEKLEDLVHWRSDSENSHDSLVSKSMRDNMIKIKAINAEDIGQKPPLYEIPKLIKKYAANQNVAEKAIKVTNRMIDENAYVVAVKDNEKNVLDEVWKRINSPSNKKKYASIMRGFCNNMASAVDASGEIKCPNGRVSRTIGSLVLDKNPKLGEIKTKQVIYNTMVFRASAIRDADVKKLPEKLKYAYETGDYKKYATKKLTATEIQADVEDFERRLKNKIANEIRREYSKYYNPSEIDIYISEFQAAV